jgi:Tripartite tricarboxylate transporter TctB family
MEIPGKRINWGETVIPILTLLFCVTYFLQTTDAPKIAIYWPVIIAALVGILWLPVLIKFVFVKEESADRSKLSLAKTFGGSQRPLLILFGSIGYLLVVPWLGFSLSNFCFMLTIFRGLGSDRWIQNLLVAFGITVFLHVALIIFMQLTLPQLNLGIIAI